MRLPVSRLVLGLTLLACSAPFAVSAPAKIGVLLKGRSAFWSAVEKGAVEEAERLGATTIVKAPPAETDISIQIQFVNAFASQGIDALVISPSNRDALAGPVAALAAKGVKIVVIDSPLSGDASSVFIGTNHRAAGEAAGQLLSTLVTANDTVCFLKHSQGGGATEQREIGALTKLRDIHPKIVVHGDIYASSEKGVEAERAALVLSKYPTDKVILATGTPGTMAMLKAIQERRPSNNVKLVGFGFNLNPDVASAIDSGTMHGWVAQLPKDVGAKGVASAIALLKGEKVAPVIYTDFVVITKDNLRDAKVQALLSL